MSKTFTITITGDCPDSVSDAQLHVLAAEASLAVLNPQEWHGVKPLVTNVGTGLGVESSGDGPAVLSAEDHAKRIVTDPQFYGQKIQAIKELRSIGGMGLKEAKDVIDSFWYLQGAPK